MCKRFGHMEFFVPAILLLSLLLFIPACNGLIEEPQDHSEQIDTTPPQGTIIFIDDSTEWRVWVPYGSVLASDPYSVDSPFHIPTRDEAKFLKTLTYGSSGRRYLTDDGYTFGMPSTSVTKAGTKTKYTVLALWRRRYIITQEF